MSSNRFPWFASLLAACLWVSGHPAWASPRSQPAEVLSAGKVINIVKWDGNQFPPVYERSAQRPLTAADIAELNRNGFAPEAIARMIQERRYSGDASVRGLVELTRLGLEPQVVQAVSLHALPPNRSIQVTVELAFEGASQEARKRYLYIIVPDGAHERILTADLRSVVGGSWHHDILLDHSDPVLPRQVRRVSFTDRLPLKTHGPKDMIILTSAHPDIRGSQDISPAERAGIRRFTIDYPASSPVQDCRVRIRFRQDPALPHKWDMTATHVTCEWN
jgi:hypothetical protein